MGYYGQNLCGCQILQHTLAFKVSLGSVSLLIDWLAEINTFIQQGCIKLIKSESESESALFAKCVQTHEEFVVVFKKLLVHTCIHTYIHINIHI